MIAHSLQQVCRYRPIRSPVTIISTIEDNIAGPAEKLLLIDPIGPTLYMHGFRDEKKIFHAIERDTKNNHPCMIENPE